MDTKRKNQRDKNRFQDRAILSPIFKSIKTKHMGKLARLTIDEPLQLEDRIPTCNCLVLNPYTQTLKKATFHQTLENWYAIIGTEQVEQFPIHDGQGTTCLYKDDLHNGIVPYGTLFENWFQPMIGILIFVGPPDCYGHTTGITDKAIEILQRQYQQAKKGRFERQ